MLMRCDTNIMWKWLKNSAARSSSVTAPQTHENLTFCIPHEWKYWISHNVDRGCSKDGIFKILHDHGFQYDAIRTELNYEPSTPFDRIPNPLELTEREDSRRTERFSCRETQWLGRVFIPNAKRLSSRKVELYELEDFLDSKECEKALGVICKHLRPSTITKKGEPDRNFRTGKTCDLALLNDPFIKELDRRICNIIGIDPTYSEGIQAQFYKKGEQFKAHTDYFEPNSPEFERFAREAGQRTWTFMVYLNDTAKGGATQFVNLGKTFFPRAGTALIWNNLDPNGEPNPATLHRGMPVDLGYKAIITKWFRSKSRGSIITKEPNEYVPNYTRAGIRKLWIPGGIHQMLVDFYEQNKGNARVEFVEDFIENPHGAGSALIELPQSMKAKIHSDLQPVCEQWCEMGLEPTYVYGMREYRNKTTLKLHRDRIHTHVISAMLVVTERVNEGWPLEIEDNYYRRHEIIAAPGEMILYEGARLKHGRPKPLNGDYFCNVFVHYKPRH